VILHTLAAKYIWWKTPEEALRFPRRVIAQVMEIGTLEDVELLLADAGPQQFVEVLKCAEAGWFTPPSWHYWHYRLGLAGVGEVPPLPVKSALSTLPPDDVSLVP